MGRMRSFDPSTRRLAEQALRSPGAFAQSAAAPTAAELRTSNVALDARASAIVAAGHVRTLRVAGLACAELIIVVLAAASPRPGRVLLVGTAILGALALSWVGLARAAR